MFVVHFIQESYNLFYYDEICIYSKGSSINSINSFTFLGGCREILWRLQVLINVKRYDGKKGCQKCVTSFIEDPLFDEKI